jgi:hypothetical protein
MLRKETENGVPFSGFVENEESAPHLFFFYEPPNSLEIGTVGFLTHLKDFPTGYSRGSEDLITG